MECVPKKADPKQDPYFVPYENSENYVCFDPDSWATIVEWIKRHTKNPVIIQDLSNRGLLMRERP